MKRLLLGLLSMLLVLCFGGCKEKDEYPVNEQLDYQDFPSFITDEQTIRNYVFGNPNELVYIYVYGSSCAECRSIKSQVMGILEDMGYLEKENQKPKCFVAEISTISTLLREDLWLDGLLTPALIGIEYDGSEIKYRRDYSEDSIQVLEALASLGR